MLGWPKNYLLVGLPLLRALSPMDVRAVIAHEFGHLSGNHGKFSGWIYRVRQTWTQIMQNVDQHGRFGSGILKRFFDWYAPYFGAYSFVLARAQEYEADRCSVAVVGKRNAARALINLELRESALNENFWPSFYKRADKQPEPPGDAYTEMLQSLREPLAPEKAQVWFSQSLTRRHRYDDTHPALADRLESMGYTNVRKEADVNSFAMNDDQPRSDQYFLATVPSEFVDQKNQWWKEQLSTGWSERHKFVLEAEQSLLTLAEKAKTTQLTVDELWDRARFMAGTQGNEPAIPFLNDVLAVMEDHAAANYKLGEALLEQSDEAGIKHIEAAIVKDHSATPSGYEMVFVFLTKQNRPEEAEQYRQRVVDYYDKVELARQERNTIKVSDDFSSHGLTREAVEALRVQLANVPRLASAHLVKKVVKHFPEDPSYVLGVIAKHAWYSSQNDKRDQELIDQLATTINYPGYTYIIAMEHNHKGLRKVFKRIEGSQIYNEKLP
jgi:tetratricopeptide (TPR) repeat protein